MGLGQAGISRGFNAEQMLPYLRQFAQLPSTMAATPGAAGCSGPAAGLTATQQVAQTGTGSCLSCCSHCAQGVEHVEAKLVASRT